ncbi:Protein of unknown function DUF2599 [Segniliparus rotundus DSM 44985]|uniref:DUF2599 domain-containing protein n=1 Tax=Segniliparus rotundus (strain ATCC BAA-972 / CDC 1076 / CIP 108378 / DSM 44985 / JCM 13578) TaxID=640132 RepID=D6ZCZ8_SEGRD|nr:DUF2599 domain-containing protein [Segniliparus rotundus]ADG99185.1 Protein of unknown function DUF2599 [Segniliparus rotundus DSM 44985]
MRALFSALIVCAFGGEAAWADPADRGGRWIEHVVWARASDGPSLHVFPTRAGRDAPAELQGAEWDEVLSLAPEADSPGMREQFDCHQSFAKSKESWNLEPWRPAVGGVEMLASGCNPGKRENPAT